MRNRQPPRPRRTRHTLRDARAVLTPGDKLAIECYPAAHGWSAAIHNLGQCWSRGHTSPRHAALAVAHKVLYGARSQATVGHIKATLGAVTQRAEQAFTLRIPAGWKPPQPAPRD